MKSLSCFALATILMCTLSAVTQSSSDQPKPSPELKKLNYFAGTWKLTGEMKTSPYGPGGKISSLEKNHWMEGGFFLISDTKEMTPRGADTAISIFGYNSEEKVYTYHSINSFGESEDSKGTLIDNTWSWVNETKLEGKTIKGRFVAKELSPTAYSFKFEMATDNAEWSTIMEGTATKQ